MVVSVATDVANIGYLRFAEKASPSTPASGFALAYFKADGLLYTMDDAGLETGPITNAAAVVLDPASDVRNLIQPTGGNFDPLTVKNQAGTIGLMISKDALAGFGTAPSSPVHIVTAIDPVNISDQSVLVNATWTPPDTDPQWTRGITVFANIAGSNVPTDGYITGVESNAQSLGAAVQPLRSFSALLRNATSGVVASGTSFYAETPTKGGSGTFTNAYGLYVEDFTAATNNYAIYTNAGFIVFNAGGHAESDVRMATDSEDNFFYLDTGANWLRIGDWDTNYTQFVADGIQTMVGTGRVKKIMNIPVGGTGGGANKPTFTEAFSPFDGYLMSINDDLHYEFEIPYDCDTSEDIEFEIHWYIDRAYADENAEVNWQISYRAVTEDGTEPVDSGGSGDTVTSGDINIPATNKSYLKTGMTISAGTISQNDHLGIDLSRIALVGGTGPGGAKEPIISQVHIEYTCNKLGEAL